MSARPYRAASPWPKAAILFILAAFLGLRVWQSRGVISPSAAQPLLSEGEFVVARTVDGDTLQLASGEFVRLLGVDTPETVAPGRPVEPWGPEAAEFTKRFIGAEPVRLTFDQERHDRYGRHLAYVWRDSSLLNEELIRAGYSEAKTSFPYSRSMKDRFLAAQRDAKRQLRGIWSK